MISRKLVGVSAASVGATAAVAVLLLGTVPGSAIAQSTSSAYGIAAQGLLPINPTPQAAAPPNADDALLEVPQPLGLGVLRISVADHFSSARAADVNLLNGAVTANVIETICDNGVGTVSILNGSVFETNLPSAPSIGDAVDVGVITIVANRQTTNGDGSLTVDGLVISVLPGGDPTALIGPRELSQLQQMGPALGIAVPENATDAQDLTTQLQELNPDKAVPHVNGSPAAEIIVASATCAARVALDEPEAPDDEAPEAPTPDVVETRLPVTH